MVGGERNELRPLLYSLVGDLKDAVVMVERAWDAPTTDDARVLLMQAGDSFVRHLQSIVRMTSPR